MTSDATGPIIPYGRQSLDEADIAAVVGVLRGDWLTQGPTVTAFEDRLAELTGAEHAIAFSSGTAALHGTLAVSGIGAGSLVATSPLSFAASAACARYVGASVTFVDIDETLNLDVTAVPPCDALVAVHYAGLPVDLSRLEHRPSIVVEDAAHALGAMTPDGPVGNCARSDMTVFSFHPVKVVTTAEGGAVTTNSSDLADRLRRFRSHGTRPDPAEGGWYYVIDEVGFNYRLSDVHAALGLSQLSKLETFLGRRNELADRYRRLLSDLPVVLPPEAGSGSRHGYHLFPVRVVERQRVYDELRSRGIGVQVHYVPIYRHPAYAPDSPPRCPRTEEAYASLLSLPLFPAMSDGDQDQVVNALREVL